MPDTLVSAEAPAPSTPSTSSTTLIHARGLTKRFGDFTAVDGIDFDVDAGESFGFLGPNGAGKTSTMRMIGCVSPVTAGTLRILGLDPAADGSPAPPETHDHGPPSCYSAAGSGMLKICPG